MIHPLSSFFKNNYDPTHNTTQDAYEIFSIHIFIDIENKKYTFNNAFYYVFRNLQI